MLYTTFFNKEAITINDGRVVENVASNQFVMESNEILFSIFNDRNGNYFVISPRGEIYFYDPINDSDINDPDGDFAKPK